MNGSRPSSPSATKVHTSHKGNWLEGSTRDYWTSRCAQVGAELRFKYFASFGTKQTSEETFDEFNT